MIGIFVIFRCFYPVYKLIPIHLINCNLLSFYLFSISAVGVVWLQEKLVTWRSGYTGTAYGLTMIVFLHYFYYFTLTVIFYFIFLFSYYLHIYLHFRESGPIVRASVNNST